MVGIYATYLRFFRGGRQHQPDRRAALGAVGRVRHTVRSRIVRRWFCDSRSGVSARVGRYRPVLKTSVLLSFLGYSTVCIGMLYELGLPWRIWHPICTGIPTLCCSTFRSA